jgi:hypothetical protein
MILFHHWGQYAFVMHTGTRYEWTWDKGQAALWIQIPADIYSSTKIALSIDSFVAGNWSVLVIMRFNIPLTGHNVLSKFDWSKYIIDGFRLIAPCCPILVLVWRRQTLRSTRFSKSEDGIIPIFLSVLLRHWQIPTLFLPNLRLV